MIVEPTLDKTYTAPLRLKILQGIENICNSRSFFRECYYRLFYKSMISREIQAAGLSEGSRVLHIGCGPMPYTALSLVDAGFFVTAVEVDPVLADTARNAAAASRSSSRITVITADGFTIDPSTFDAVWVSLHAQPKDVLAEKLLSSMKEGAVLVLRNPRGWLRMFYRKTRLNFGNSVKQGFGKTSLIIRKSAESAGSTLYSLQVGERGTLTSVPDHPLLSPLGFRPGKEVVVAGRSILGGPIVVRIQGRSSAVHRSLAQQIQITPVLGKA